MKVYLATFGCRANQYDSEAVRSMVLAGGGEMADSASEADVAVFNSCAVTADAEADLRQSVRRSARMNPRLRSFVMGCASALELVDGGPRPLSRRIAALPSVEGLVDGADLDALALSIGIPGPLPGGSVRQTGARGLLRIQDGCAEHCTFCATTIARGANRSRAADAVVEEARSLAERHPEIVLTGVHIGSYGADLGSSLGALVERLVTEVPGVRFRLSSLEATEVDDSLVELFAGAPGRLAPYLHAPLQSGSDRVLKRMGRHWYTAASYRDAVERIAKRAPVFGLGADVIAGFPGETRDDHLATLALVNDLPFTSLHVFPFSVRPGTAAERLSGRLSGSVVRGRARDLRELAARKRQAHMARRDGGAADVVVVAGGMAGKGITEDYLTVGISGARPARGERFRARLEITGDSLAAFAVAGAAKDYATP